MVREGLEMPRRRWGILQWVDSPWPQRRQSHSCSPQGLDEQGGWSETTRGATYCDTQGYLACLALGIQNCRRRSVGLVEGPLVSRSVGLLGQVVEQATNWWMTRGVALGR